MKKLLIVVDYQKDFVDGSLGFSGAELLEDGICRKIEEYRNSGQTIVFTLDTHRENYLETQEGMNLPVPHCFTGTQGHALYGRIGEMASGYARFEKAAFGSDGLYSWLRDNCFDIIELVGLVSNICVLTNAVLAKTACPESQIVVDAACTASFDSRLNEEALDVLEGIQVRVTNRK